MKNIFAIALGLFVSAASLPAWADAAYPCSCGGSPSSTRTETDPSGPGDYGGGGQGASGTTGSTASTGGTAGAGGATGGTGGAGGATGGTAGAGGTGGSGMKQLEKNPGNALACTEFAATSSPTAKLAAGMGFFLLLPLARRRTRKRGGK